MATTKPSMHYGALIMYTVGFVLSLFATLVAFWLVSVHMNFNHGVLSHKAIQVSVIALAVVQLCVQLIFFLHLGREQKPRWNSIAFLFMVETVVVLVLGTLWIMANLDYNMMPKTSDEQIFKEELIDPR